MFSCYVSPFYAVSVSTLPDEADAQMSVVFADSHGPSSNFDYVSRSSVNDPLLVRTIQDVLVGSEPLVSIWARCAHQLPVHRMPQPTGPVDHVSVSIHACDDGSNVVRSRLLEHMVVYRQGPRMLIEFSDERISFDCVGAAKQHYATTYELAVHATSILLSARGWPWHAKVGADADGQAGSGAGRSEVDSGSRTTRGDGNCSPG
jgi:hypothetical protein